MLITGSEQEPEVSLVLWRVLEDHQALEFLPNTLSWDQSTVNEAMSNSGLLLLKFIGSKLMAVTKLCCPLFLRAPLQSVFLLPSGKGFL